MQVNWTFYDRNGAVVQPPQPDPTSVGIITWFMSADAGTPTMPSPEWMLCDGSSLPVASYPTLFGILGYQFGGAGANFNLPNMISRLTIGSSSAKPLGTTKAANLHNHGGSSVGHGHVMPAHTHGSPAHLHSIPNHQHQILNHTHGTGSMAIGAAVGAESAKSTGANSAAHQNHAHSLSGTIGDMTATTHTDSLITVATGVYPGGDSDPSAPLQTDGGQIPISTPAEILPPYFNTYYIIKVQDL